MRREDRGIHWFKEDLKQQRLAHQLICNLHSKYGGDELLSLKRQSRAHYRKAISMSKLDATCRLIETSNNKPKAIWNVINTIRGTTAKPPPEIDCDELNHHFVQRPRQIVDALPDSPMSPLSLCNVSVGEDSAFSFSGVSEFEVRELLRGLKSSNTKDIFGVSSNFIKRNISVFVTPVTKLINCAFTTGEFPSLLKEAYVIPIHKGGASEDINNYRPISILPTFSKVFERAMHRQIAEYLESGEWFYKCQFGFRRGKSTTDAVLRFTETCLSTFERGEYCVTQFLDLSRAFDCVSHVILLQKLKHVYNFDSLSLQLIASYLGKRSQKVVVGDGMSESLIVDRGVPQGSILGPLLFLVFFNDFPSYVVVDDSVECIVYADDATIMVRGSNFDEVKAKSEEVLDRVRMWTIANQLSLNNDKTVEMIFSLRDIDCENPQGTKFLGVHLNPPLLKFQEHADAVGRRISRNIFVLRQLTSAVTPDVLRTAYFALIQSHVGYCILAWGGSSAGQYIFKMQRRAVRVLGGVGFRDDCKDLFIRFNILTMPCQYILSCILYANTHKHSFATNRDYHNYYTRGRDHIRPNFCRLTTTQRGFLHNSVALYNKLPPGSRNLTNPALKKQLKCLLLKKAYYSTEEFLNCDDVIV